MRRLRPVREDLRPCGRAAHGDTGGRTGVAGEAESPSRRGPARPCRRSGRRPRLTLAPQGGVGGSSLVRVCGDRHSYLSLVPGYGWTLEDCEPPPPHSRADLSYLTLVPNEPENADQGGAKLAKRVTGTMAANIDHIVIAPASAVSARRIFPHAADSTHWCSIPPSASAAASTAMSSTGWADSGPRQAAIRVSTATAICSASWTIWGSPRIRAKLKVGYRLWRDGERRPIISALHPLEAALSLPRLFTAPKAGRSVSDYYAKCSGGATTRICCDMPFRR